MGRNAPRHSEHNQPGSQKDPFGKRSGARPDKAELLSRMKAAQEKAAGKAPTAKDDGAKGDS